MAEIKMKIKDCTECPFWETSKVYTADSWENVQKWTCKKKKKVIAGYLETFDKNPKIPDWCPILVK